MMLWWLERQPRERALLVAGCVLTLGFGFLQFVFLPLLQYTASARDRYDAAIATLADIETGARTLQGARAVAGARGEGAMRTVVAATATELGLAVSRLQPLDAGDLDVWLDGVSSPLLYQWIGRLQDRGIPVVRATIQKRDEATVSAQITFSGGSDS
jgi:type II secretory pathway component PulM